MKTWKLLIAGILCCSLGGGLGIIGCGDDDEGSPTPVIPVIPDVYSGTYVYALEAPPGDYIAKLKLTITSVSGLCSDTFAEGQVQRFGVQDLSETQLVLVFLNEPSAPATFERTAGEGTDLEGSWTKANGKTYQFVEDATPVVPEEGVFTVINDPACAPSNCAVLPFKDVKGKLAAMLLYLAPVAFLVRLRRKFPKDR